MFLFLAEVTCAPRTKKGTCAIGRMPKDSSQRARVKGKSTKKSVVDRSHIHQIRKCCGLMAVVKSVADAVIDICPWRQPLETLVWLFNPLD